MEQVLVIKPMQEPQSNLEKKDNPINIRNNFLMNNGLIHIHINNITVILEVK